MGMYPNAWFIVAYLLFSIGWFFLGHLLSFFALGRIVKRGEFSMAAKAAGLLTGAWVVIVGIVVAFSMMIGTTRTVGFIEVLIAGILAPLLYLIGLAWLANRFYGLKRAYAMLAALAIGAAYLLATLILSVIVQLVFVVGFMAYMAS